MKFFVAIFILQVLLKGRTLVGQFQFVPLLLNFPISVLLVKGTVRNCVGSRYTEMSEYYPTDLATFGYVSGWGNWLYDSPALRSRHRYDTYYESWLCKSKQY